MSTESDFLKRKEVAINASCDDFLESLDVNTETKHLLQDAFKVSVDKGIDQYLKPMLENMSISSATASSSSSGIKFSSTTTKTGSRVSARILAWNDWKKTNDEKKKYKDENGADISAYQWWGKNKWAQMTSSEKKPYDDQAKKHNAQIKKDNVASGVTEKKTPSKSAFQLFQERNKQFYGQKEKFTCPETKGDIGGYELARKVWSKNLSDDQKEPFTREAKQIKESGKSADLKMLPHLDFDKIKTGNWTYESIELIDT